jgi:hypothetical protein
MMMGIDDREFRLDDLLALLSQPGFIKATG